MATTNTMINLPASGSGSPTGSAGGDLGGTYPNPTVVSVAHVTTGTLPIANGGTGQVTAQAALDALLPTQSAKANDVLTSDGTHTAFKSTPQQVRVTFDGGGSTITTGHKVWFSCEFAGTIVGWVLLADQSGSIDISVSKCTFAAFDSVSSITASNDPSISSAIKNSDTTLTGWTKSVLAGDILEFQVVSVTNFQHAQLFLNIAGV